MSTWKFRPTLEALEDRCTPAGLFFTAAPAEPLDPDLARVVEAWPKLPEAIRAALLAIVANSCLGPN
jgi:hypothetical protein